mgnify:FL=1|jgi:hypothetical protein
MVNVNVGKKVMYAIDFAVVLMSVGFLLYFIGVSQPQVIAPLDDSEITETEVLFFVENAEMLLIDDNTEFTTPDFYDVEEGLVLNLKPDTYYWKVIGQRSSEIRKFTIVSKISLEFKRTEGSGYGVVNVGNEALNIDIYSEDLFIERFRLGVDEEVGVSGDKVIGGAS